jgi:hypothetical protein
LVGAYFNDDFEDYVPAGLIVDYSASIEDVYSSFVKAITDATGRLDILAFCTGTRSGYVRRTWTPDWNEKRDKTKPVGILDAYISYITVEDYLPTLPFDASPGTQCAAIFGEDLNTLTISGIIYDRLIDDSLGIARKAADISNIWRILIDQQQHSFRRSSEFKGLLQSFEFDSKNSEEGIGLSKLRKVLLDCLKLNPKALESELKQFETDLEEANDLRVLAKTIINIDGQNRHPPLTDPNQLTDSDTVMCVAALYGRTLGLTEGSNIVRPLTDDPRPGDLICVILGCAMPLLLRPVDGYYEVHGEVYVPGIMHGEAVAALAEGKLVLQDFELH